MEGYIRVFCTHYGHSFDKMIQQYNINKKIGGYFIDRIIEYKIKHNKDIIYKEDIPKICSKYYRLDMSQEEFMENVMRDIKHYNLDINNLTIANSYCSGHLLLYYLSTFLDYEPVDIKIALKD
jgi:hypothetical protein